MLIPEAKDQDPSNLGLAGFAKVLCSAIFVSKHNEAFAYKHASRVAVNLMHLPASDLPNISYEIDYDQSLVRASLDGQSTRTAKFYGDQGSIIHPIDHEGIFFHPESVSTNLPNSENILWPAGDRLSSEPLPPEINQFKLQSGLDLAFKNSSPVSAFVVIYKGRLIAEKYAPWASKDTLLENWSMGKSLTGTLIGRLINDGHLNLNDRAPIPEWSSKTDPRSQILISHLMQMSSGLKFNLHEVLETTKDGYTIIKTDYPDHYYIYSGAINAFKYVANRPLQFKPGTVGRYRNTDPLSLGYIIKRTVQNLGLNYLQYPQQALFDKIGIRKLILETDPFGNFLSSGFELGKARDWARLGLLYLQDGIWGGERLLPEGFVDFVRTPAPAWNNEEGEESISRYGGQWWLNTTGAWDAPNDAFYAAGAGGQMTLVIPSKDMVIVRLTDYEGSPSTISKTQTQKAIRVILDSIES